MAQYYGYISKKSGKVVTNFYTPRGYVNTCLDDNCCSVTPILEAPDMTDAKRQAMNDVLDRLLEIRGKYANT